MELSTLQVEGGENRSEEEADQASEGAQEEVSLDAGTTPKKSVKKKKVGNIRPNVISNDVIRSINNIGICHFNMFDGYKSGNIATEEPSTLVLIWG